VQRNQFLPPTGLINQLLQPSGISLDTRQFWWYAFLYWGFFSVMWSFQATLAWMLTPDARMYATEIVYWLIEFLFWWLATPLIIYCAQIFPLLNHQKTSQLFRQTLIHLLIVAVLYMLELVIEYSILGRAMAHERGEVISVRKIVWVFSLSYGTAFSQYMLLVVCFNIFMHMYRFQALQQQHLRMELTNEQLKSQLASAQLQSLKMQLNPHFLFNTLHTVVSMIIQHQNKRAAHMVTSLSDLLRSVLARRQANFLELREELQLTRQYLAIQQIRFEDKLRIEYAVEPEVEQCLVPQLILQPLVENAVTHGIADLTEGALIRISARRSDSTVRIEVFDNGTGQNQLQPNSGTGLGLNNTLLRLQQAYGENASLLFEQPPGGTTTVSLLIPYL
jgi:sensor histidine kinase YesM